MKRLLTSILLLLCILSATAQEVVEKKPITKSVAFASSLSYTGFNIALGVGIHHPKWTLFLGPKLSLTQSALPAEGASGVATNFRYFPTGKEQRWNGFINLDYQLQLSSPDCRFASCEEKTAYTHEYSAGYGLLWKTSEKIHIANSINLGLYNRNLYNHYLNVRENFGGYNTVFRLSVYHLFNR